MYKNVEISFTSEEYDTSKLDNGINDIIEFDIMKIILTTSKYQRENLENPNVIKNGMEKDMMKKVKQYIY